MTKKISLISLAIPIFFEITLFVALGFFDIYFLGQVSDSAAGAAGAANQIISIAAILFSVISAGTGVLISQFIGAKEREEVHKTVVVSYVIITMIGVVTSLFLIVFSEPLLKIIGIGPTLMAHGKIYLQIVGSFMIFQALLNVGTVTMRSHGYAKETLFITALMNVINIVGDAILIFGLFGFPQMGAAGVAIATSLSRTVAAFISLIFVLRRITPYSKFRYIKHFPSYILKKLLKIGLPSAMESLSYNASQLVITSIILYNLGETMYVARTYVWTIASLGFTFSIAIGQANQMLLGRYIGEKDFEKADKECMKNLKIALVFATFIGAFFLIFGEQLMGIFTDNPEIIAAGTTVLIIQALLEPGRTFNIVVINGLRGAGDVNYPVVMAVIFMWGAAVLGGFVFAVPLGLGLIGIWIGMFLDEWIRGILMLRRWRSKKWIEKSLV